MPLFEFVCSNCNESFEELVFGSAEDVTCPKCDSDRVVKKMSTFAFKSGGKFTPAKGSSCSGCNPGPGGCTSCSH